MAAAAALAAAAPSALFSQTEPGMWEVARNGLPPVRLCLADPSALTQFEHRDSSCTRNLIRDTGAEAVVHYTCKGGGFGQSSATLLTPRSLRIQTQGISAGLPFKYTFQARRVGTC